MKAVRIHEHGDIDVLKWEEVSIPSITESQVLVEIKATAMNQEFHSLVFLAVMVLE